MRARTVRIAVVLLGVGASALAATRSLTALIMTLSLVLLVATLYAFWASLRTVLGGSAPLDAGAAMLPERAALLDEKNALLRAIKDIAFEREVGKLSDSDFERLDRSYRQRAKEVLRKLDEDLAPYLGRAEQIVAQHVAQHVAPRADASGRTAKPDSRRRTARRRRACPACGTANAATASWCKECGGSMDAVACGRCGVANEPDAKFCIGCRGAMGAPSDAPQGDAPRGDASMTSILEESDHAAE